MTKPGKTPKKKTKEKSPQRTEESEYPEMDQETYNRLFQNAIEQSKAQLQQQHEEHWHMKPITCHMDFASEQTELIHPLVEAHLVDARAQGE